jgi:hypothetical protein
MTDIHGDAGIHPRKRVATYRAYHLDAAGRITKPALVFEAPDDITATARARALAGGEDQLEIWEGSRQVGPTLAPGSHP